MDGISFNPSTEFSVGGVMSQATQNMQAVAQVTALKKVMDSQTEAMNDLLKSMGKGMNINALA